MVTFSHHNVEEKTRHCLYDGIEFLSSVLLFVITNLGVEYERLDKI